MRKGKRQPAPPPAPAPFPVTKRGGPGKQVKRPLTPAQRAAMTKWLKAHPLPRLTPAQWQAWTAAHPAQAAARQKALQKWFKAHPLKQMSAQQWQAWQKAHPLPPRRTAPAPGEGEWLGNAAHGGCAAAAVANSLLLATGIQVSGADVLTLHLSAAGAPARGATIRRVLEVLADEGIGGVRPLDYAAISVMDLDERQWALLGMTLTREQQEDLLLWDAGIPDGPGHALVLNGDEVITWGRTIPVTEAFSRMAEEAWTITWP